ncbi:MAG: hypothetical protein FJ118_17110, partial [Deltaproteobacteria bacterium]|nr:hypothetical protein [Deltaproteobacteria bacterium]
MKRWRYQEIYFVHADSGIRSTVRKLRQLGIPDKQERLPFLYLGRDYFKCLRWEEALGRGWQRIRYGQLFQDIASEHQDAYLDWTARAGEKRDKLIWWSSRLAEKNTLLDSFYHQICYLMIASHFLNEQGSILIVAESDALLNQISSKVQANRKAVRLDSRSMFLRRLTLAGRILRSWAAYGARCLAAWRAARATRTKGASVPPIASGPTVVIHTWIDESYFAATGAPSDRYFTVLPDELTKRGFRVFVLPYLANISRSRREAFAWFRACDGRYIIPADFYGITDYIWSALKTIAQVRLAREVPLFQGIDLKLLAKEFCAKQLCDASLADFIAYYTLVRRWEKLGFRIDLFVDTFENMACEKPIVMAFREFMPETVTCGYVHYLVVADLELSIYTTSLETASGAPHPDVIVCSSPYTARSLSTQCGFPAKKIRVGPSLRYLHLAEVQDVEAVEPNSVLVILSLVGAASAELLEKLLQAFGQDEGFRFWIKPHPMM